MQNFSDATYKNILDYMLSLVPDTYDTVSYTHLTLPTKA